jgi:hypothetical protein
MKFGSQERNISWVTAALGQVKEGGTGVAREGGSVAKEGGTGERRE